MFYQKLVVPRSVPYALHRRAALGILEDALAHAQVVLLTAPAGWGKTTLVANWARAQTQLAICWYALDRFDQDPVVFLRYLITALLPYFPTLQPLLEQLASGAAHSLQILIDQLVVVIAAHPEPIYLVLDDFQEIGDQQSDTAQPIFYLINLLARYAPPMRIVLMSRTLVPGIMSLRIWGSLETIDTQALAFSCADVCELAHTRYGLSLLHSQVQALVRWSHGWPAAVVLTLEEWHRQRAQAPDALANPSLGAAIDHLNIFLMEQVFAPLPPALQTFLIETAVLSDLTPQRCDALRETSNAAQMLTEVRYRALFVEVRGETLGYQEFFRHFLLKLLWESPPHARACLERAARLHQEWDEPHQAFALWLELGDLAAASALVALAGPKLRRRCEHATVIGWLEQLRLRAPLAPQLLLLQIRVAIDLADWNTAYTAIQFALLCADSDVVLEARLLEVLIACQCQEPYAGDLMAALQLDALPPHLSRLGQEVVGRVALHRGKTELAIQSLKQVLASHGGGESKTDDGDLAHIYDLLGMALAASHDSLSAMYYLRQADATWQVLGNHGRRIITLNNMAQLLVEDGNLAAARSYLEDALRLAEQHGRQREHGMLMCSMADIAMIELRFEAALEHYTSVAEQAGAQRYGERVYACAGALRAAAISGNPEARQRWSRALDAIPPEEINLYAGSVALARALAASDPDTAQTHLAQAEQVHLHAPHDQAQVLLLRAQLAYQQGGWAAAAPHWEKLERHLRGGYLDPLLRAQCNAVPGLLAAAGPSEFTRRLRGEGSNGSLRWSFHALGGCEVFCNGQILSASVRPINQLVLVRLLEAGASGLPTLRLWEDVWGDQPFSSDALRQALSRIRRALGLPIQLQKSHCLLQLHWEHVFYDVMHFEQPLPSAPDTALLQTRIALYRGAFLGHLHNETHWLALRRMMLHRRVLLLREALALAIEATDPRGALQIYSLVLEEDGCREAAAAGAMRCAADLGDRALAILIYQRFCRQLIDHLGTDPSPSIMQVYQQVA